jgi:hypothetical protein
MGLFRSLQQWRDRHDRAQSPTRSLPNTVLLTARPLGFRTRASWLQ